MALGVLWITVPAIMGVTLLANLAPVREWLAAHPSSGVFVFMMVLAGTTGFGLLPPYAQAILGGWAFGTVAGTGAVMCGLLGGATIGFFFARLVSGDAVIRLIDHYPRASVIRKALVDTSQRRTFLLILLLRLPPNSPFAIANLAMGASGVRAAPFLGGTMLGLLPRTLAICAAAATASATGAADIQDLAAKQGWIWLLVGVAGLVIALSVITAVSRRALARAGL